MKPGTYVEQHVKTYICTKFDGFNLKKSTGMTKLTGSSRCPLCAYLVSQNPNDPTPPRSYDNKCLCQVWKYSVKNYGCKSANGACLPCHLLTHLPAQLPTHSGDNNTPEIWKAARWNRYSSTPRIIIFLKQYSLWRTKAYPRSFQCHNMPTVNHRWWQEPWNCCKWNAVGRGVLIK